MLLIIGNIGSTNVVEIFKNPQVAENSVDFLESVCDNLWEIHNFNPDVPTGEYTSVILNNKIDIILN